MEEAWPMMATQVRKLSSLMTSKTNVLLDVSQKPLLGVIVCCTSIPPERRVSDRSQRSIMVVDDYRHKGS